ncbi:UNVERIFIED_CONTAM: putative enoyl-CoA hydratase 2, mitochondrial [Sesamum latifolium]|uniref:Enoyl-CoA hydratase 2, mitochondrial n=1 Tax=Sesamum latifolium TaxID=2727402 RepID=A0AAW2VXN8_9LAMI
MVVLTSVAKSLKNLKIQSSSTHLFRFRSIRTLLLQSAFESVKLEQLTDSESGLVNYCATAGEAGAKALEIARDINQKGPLAIRMEKRAIDGGVELDMASALALEEDCHEQLLHTKDRLEGLAAFAERRKPNYKGE